MNQPNHLATLMRHLEAYVQEEIGAQSRTIALLESQELAVGESDHAKLRKANLAIDAELRSATERTRRRALLLEGFGKLWKLDPSTLSLSSLIERVGNGAERLQRQRGELRDVTALVARKARRIGSAARAHQRLTVEILETVLEDAEGAGLEAGGALVNAEA